jgi:hypothetical protein
MVSSGLLRRENLKSYTLPLRYESNRLILSVGLLGVYVNTNTTILDIINHSVFYLKQRLENWILSPSTARSYVAPGDSDGISLHPVRTQTRSIF